MNFRNKFVVEVPTDARLTEKEIITRCDNRTYDLTQPAGNQYHQGGAVEKIGPNTYSVLVNQ